LDIIPSDIQEVIERYYHRLYITLNDIAFHYSASLSGISMVRRDKFDCFLTKEAIEQLQKDLTYALRLHWLLCQTPRISYNLLNNKEIDQARSILTLHRENTILWIVFKNIQLTGNEGIVCQST
jgi:hypothetical protein